MRRFLEESAFVGMWLAFKLGRLAVRIAPRRFLISLSKLAADAGFVIFRGFRTRSSVNLRAALRDQLNEKEIKKTVRGSLRNFFRDFVEIGIALEASREEICREIPLLGQEHLEAALAKGKGAIALSAHLGNFFLLGTRLAIEGYPTHVLVNQTEDEHVSQLMDHYCSQIGQKIIHARPRREASRELVRVLRRNELAVVIADEFRSGDGLHVPFFGRTVLARRGPATLALRTGAAVVPMCLVRNLNGGLKLIIEPEIELSRAEGSKASITENTRRITQWLERTVRAYPDQWNWMNIRWQEPSAGPVLQEERRYQGFA